MRTTLEIAGFKSVCRKVLVMALIVSLPCMALAEISLARSEPAEGNSIQAPRQLELWFNEPLATEQNTVAIFPITQLNSQDRTNLTQGAVTVDPQDPTHLTVGVQHLLPGEYLVVWRAMPRDGQGIPGRFRFRVTRIQSPQ
ncbi:MAG: copper resistance protein CopC [Pedosphaera sp.]|nr:copper resistance protein CopC [Pedosphaera sp.]